MTAFHRNRGVEGIARQADPRPPAEHLGQCQHCKTPRVEQQKGPPACPRGCESTGSSPPLSF